MTEADLQRLAEIIHGLSAQDRGSALWQSIAGLTVGFLTGFLSNLALRLIELWRARMSVLQKSREDLFSKLGEFMILMRRGPSSPTQSYEAEATSLTLEMRSVVDSARDMKYARLLQRIFFDEWPKGSESERFKIIRDVRARLEPSVLSVSEQLRAEMLAGEEAVTGRFVVRGARKLEKLLGRRSGEGELVRRARLLEQLLGIV